VRIFESSFDVKYAAAIEHDQKQNREADCNHPKYDELDLTTHATPLPIAYSAFFAGTGAIGPVTSKSPSRFFNST